MSRLPIGAMWAALALCLLSLPAAAQFPYAMNTIELDQQVSTTGVSSFLFTSPNKALASFTAVAGASAGFVMLIDAVSLPANGPLADCGGPGTTRPCLMWCVPVAANGYVDRQWNSPMSFQSGILAVFSTTGCASLTASATAQFFGQSP